MQAEVYQNMLWNFNGAYYLSSQYTSVDNDLDSFIADAEKVAQEHNVHIFSRQDFPFMVMMLLFVIVLKIRWILKKKHILL